MQIISTLRPDTEKYYMAFHFVAMTKKTNLFVVLIIVFCKFLSYLSSFTSLFKKDPK